MSSNHNRNLSIAINQEMIRQNTQISTPVRHSSLPPSARANMDRFSSPFTPHSSDHLFQSVPRMHNILSSPPVAISPSPGFDNVKNKYSNTTILESGTASPLKLSLKIGANGKAAIISPDMFRNFPLKPTESTTITKNDKPIFNNNKIESTTPSEKNKILDLLKKMRSTTSTMNSTKNKVKKSAHQHKTTKPPITEPKTSRRPSITSTFPTTATNIPVVDATSTTLNEITNKLPVPQVTVTNSLNTPSTPRTKNTHFRTGFTPSIGLDMVLSNSFSPRMFFNNNAMGNNESSLDDRLLKFGSPASSFSQKSRILPKPITSQAFQQQFPFKYSGSDPLLITDDENGSWFDALNGSANASSAPSSLLLASPKPHIATFASPSLNNRRLKPTSTKAKSLIEPATPNDSNLTVTNPSLQFTPLIQQTMNGSLSNKIVTSTISMSPISGNGTHKGSDSDSLSSNEKDDARLTLKRLITRS